MSIINEESETYGDRVICPYCTFEDFDTFEFTRGEEDGHHECIECGKEFSWVMRTIINFSAYKLSEAKE